MINVALLAPAAAALVAAIGMIVFSHRIRDKAGRSAAAGKAKEQPAE
jgi:hypothetical protein